MISLSLIWKKYISIRIPVGFYWIKPLPIQVLKKSWPRFPRRDLFSFFLVTFRESIQVPLKKLDFVLLFSLKTNKTFPPLTEMVEFLQVRRKQFHPPENLHRTWKWWFPSSESPLPGGPHFQVQDSMLVFRGVPPKKWWETPQVPESPNLRKAPIFNRNFRRLDGRSTFTLDVFPGRPYVAWTGNRWAVNNRGGGVGCWNNWTYIETNIKTIWCVHV